MAKKQELDIKISADGRVTINVSGSKGRACLELTRDLEESLGIVVDREKKSSFFEQEEPVSIQIQEEQG
jgi:hypothetical protein